MNISFKKKSKRDPTSDPRKNISTLHTEKMKYFEDLQASLPKKRKHLDDINKEETKIQNRITQELKKNHGTKLYPSLYEIQNKKRIAKDDIRRIEIKEEEQNYLLNTCNILKVYFKDNKQSESLCDSDCGGGSSEQLPAKQRIIIKQSESLCDSDCGGGGDGKQLSAKQSGELLTSGGTIAKLENYVEVTQKSNNSQLLDEYLKKTLKYHSGNTYINSKKFKKSEQNPLCSSCGIKMILENVDCFYVCSSCGLIIESEDIFGKPGFKEMQENPYKNNFCYKRINHFNELLSQIQAKETTQIPIEVIEKLRIEIKKEGININKIKPKKLRSYLKKIEENKYYEHTMHIIYLLNNKPPLTMSVEMEERLRKMFEEIQEPFNRHCPVSRKNFLNYSYVLYKFCQLLHYDDFLQYFPLLKSREKLYQQDQIWRKICYDLGYEFIASI